MKFWMTPSPFKLTESINDHLFKSDHWKETAMLVDVFKIHGAILSSQWPFQRLNVPMLVYTCNKHRMRIAWENIVAGNREGEAYAATEKGRNLRQEAEDATDRYFDAAWISLNEVEMEEIKGLLGRLAEVLKSPEEDPAE